MDKIIIQGGKPLNGVVHLSGCKNSAMAILPATLLARGRFEISNVPDIEDVRNYLEILKGLGSTVAFSNNTAIIDTTNATGHTPNANLAQRFRASNYLLGVLSARNGIASVAHPGGCDIGVRTMDYHEIAFKAMGATWTDDGSNVIVEAKALHPAEIEFPKISVGATLNTLFLATAVQGTVIIRNAAEEPHVVDAISFLGQMGADIRIIDKNTYQVRGGKPLKPCDHTIIPDPIEAGTFMVAAAATKGKVLIQDIISQHMKSVKHELMRMGATVIFDPRQEDAKNLRMSNQIERNGDITVCNDKRLKAVDITTHPYPDFPTDVQQPISTLLAISEGTCVVDDQLYENRYKNLIELKKMGAQVTVNGHLATITGVERLHGAHVEATDLRGGAAMIIAGLVAEGETVISHVYHIDRGYENIVEKLRALGADIVRVSAKDEEDPEQKDEI
ncbi:UDP-N-acetylglucosamine 1-carboxyvinyltransferase [Clostridiaceae bacterium JG1575]|nr:UDP-N-acetylglucosamine 1-carboxyvinyltransferase [Clostridiaceae bacterium JG1575]